MNDCCRKELEKCWEEINNQIKPGKLKGNGWDEQSERNGMILASNIVHEIMTSAIIEHDAEEAMKKTIHDLDKRLCS